MVSGLEGDGAMPDISQIDKMAKWSSPTSKVSYEIFIFENKAHLKCRHECSRCAIPLRHADSGRGLRLLFDVYRGAVSIIRPTHARGRPSGSRGQSTSRSTVSSSCANAITELKPFSTVARSMLGGDRSKDVPPSQKQTPQSAIIRITM